MTSFNPETALEDSPCTFNLTNGKQVTDRRLRHVRHNIENDPETSNCTLEETARNYNLLTWVLFRLYMKNEAKELNEKVLELTQRRNLTSLGNCVFLKYYSGDRIGAKMIYTKFLQELKQQEDFNKLKTEAYAEQAYCYSRLGGMKNYELSIDLFEACIREYPSNYLWKFGLGLVYRRFSNFRCSSQVHSNKRSACQKLLKDVAENGDDKLKGLAYAQMAVHFCNKPSNDFEFQDLCDKALKYGAKNPTVLTHVGRCLIGTNIDKAILYLEQALELRKNSIAYHHLGECYMRKYRDNVCKQQNQHSKCTATAAITPSHLASETCSKNSIATGNCANGKQRALFTGDQKGVTPVTLGVQQCSSEVLKESELDSSPINRLDTVKELLAKAKLCYNNAVEVSQDENLPARLSLGNLYFETLHPESALSEFNQIIDLPISSYLDTFIQAYEMGGKCLQKIGDANADPEYLSEAKLYFTKAISLAADLVSTNEHYKNSTANVWETFEEMLNEVEKMPPSSKKSKEKIKLLELVKDYRNIVPVVKQMFQQYPMMNDQDIIRIGLTSCLQSGQYEDAFLLIQMAKTNSSITKTNAWDEIKELLLQACMSVVYSRLLAMSSDLKRAFQHIFELKHSQCLGLTSEDFEYGAKQKGDILIVNDDTADTETAPDFTTILAKSLSHICKKIFGLETSRNIMSDVDYSDIKTEIQLEEMKCYTVIVLILGEEDGIEYDCMLKLVHGIERKVIVINCRKETAPIPLTLKSYETVYFQDRPLSDMKLLVEKEDYSTKDILDKGFNGDKEAVIRLFGILVGYDFNQLTDLLRSVESKVEMDKSCMK